jgi:TolA-binding protein
MRSADMMKKIFILSLGFFLFSAKAQITFPGTGSSEPTSPTKQESYEQGGESTKFRLTELEKGVNWTKVEVTSLKEQIKSLQQQIETLKMALAKK